MFDSVSAVEVSLVILVVGSLLSLGASTRAKLCAWVSFTFVVASAIAVSLAVTSAFSAGSQQRTLFWLPQLGGGLTFRVDLMTAIFLAIVALVAPVSTLYSVRYMERYAGDNIAKFYPVLLLCIASMIGVLASADLLCFIVFWEFMTMTSYFLIVYERENAASQRAGLKYFIITHGATLAMVAAALVLWRISGSFHFDAVRSTLSLMLVTQTWKAHLITLLFFVGFATKAGMLPMGDWLPDAHPVAPSGMSAMLSGVLVKMGIYGLIRLFCSFLIPSPALRIWGIVLALAGTGSLFAGNLTALRENDLKRLMAFSTIGQIGYICLGLGAGAYCLAQSPRLASICLCGAILHCINHACFKSCLFLGAGSVLYRTGTRDMNKLGGLAAFMPYTAGSTAIASLSIAGVPPFNGFTSKWLIIAGCIVTGFRFPLFLVLGLIALFISIVSLAAYLKVLGSVFLGTADEKLTTREVPRSMLVAQTVLAALCVVLGVFPQLALSFVRHAVGATTGVSPSAVDAGSLWGGISIIDGSAVAVWCPLAILCGLIVFSLLSYAIQHAVRINQRSVPVWYCGEEHLPAAVRYRASSFFRPFNHAFRNVYPRMKLPVPPFPASIRSLLDFDHWFYMPVAHGVERAADGVSRTHVGTPQIYLLWIVIGAIAVVVITLALTR